MEPTTGPLHCCPLRLAHSSPRYAQGPVPRLLHISAQMSEKPHLVTHTKQISSPAPVSSLPLLVSLTALHLTLDIRLFMVRFSDCKFDALKAGTLLCFVCRQTRSAYSRIWQARLLHAGCCRRQKLPRSCLRDGRRRAEGDLTLVPEPD